MSLEEALSVNSFLTGRAITMPQEYKALLEARTKIRNCAYEIIARFEQAEKE